MAKALFTLGGLCIVFIILLLGLPFFLPVGSYMAKVSEDVNQKTGRDLKVHGDVSFRLFPSIRLTANKVTISNPPGFSAPERARCRCNNSPRSTGDCPGWAGRPAGRSSRWGRSSR